MARMVRKQVYLSVEQNERLRRAAARLRRTEADVLREAVDRHVGESRSPRVPVTGDPLWQIVGIASSREGDLSTRVDEYLYGGRRR